MDALTTTELQKMYQDAAQRARIFMTRSLTSVTVDSQKYNAELHKHHAEMAGKYLAEIIRRAGV